ncbi:methyltransferase domain-containing protein [Schumannella luteola]|uniref:SAM-dependent methyltransferase n=1 Tax=Schumannella luteola TaxID=472059 RepID=A0A852YSU1_9MICO|nr:SAM-dependent methyltransferase [Schumannella luteola]TPX05959.1 methyltransferase domain-containing protein [Schumannella luteola]
MPRYSDGSAGDADYGVIGSGYATQRRPDPRIEALIWDALGDARTVINVGAGAGSYEPHDRYVAAVEPSASMRAERPASRVPAIDGTADALPFDDDAFDAAMATVTIHQWPDLEAGLAELRRVARGPVVLLTFTPEVPERWWMPQYVPELFAVEAGRMPPIERIVTALGPGSRAEVVPVPADCIDGFGQAFFARPERTLDREVRRAMSAWSFLPPEVVERYETELARDLESGAWDREWGAFRSFPAFDVGLRLVVAR